MAHYLPSQMARDRHPGVQSQVGLNLLHWQADSSPLSHQGSPSAVINYHKCSSLNNTN